MKRALLTVAALLWAGTSFAQLGSIVFPNSGKSEAQPAFLRGVAALHSFWYDEAADNFRDAQRLDPDFALAYWGEAMSFNHPIWMEVDVDAGRKALAAFAPTAEERKKKARNERERQYLAAVELLFGDGEKPARDLAYLAAMRTLANAYPSDGEAQTFLALAILGTRAVDEGDARKQIEAAALLEPLFTANPEHPGVLHYLIHAYDDPIHAPLGLRAAQRYARVAPAAFHALHMPSHIFLQLGMWSETASSNERSYAISKAWVEKKHLGRTKRDLHSLQWLQYAYLQQNRFDDAKKLLAEIEPVPGEDAKERTVRTNMQARYAIESGDFSVLPATLTAEAPPPAEAPHAGCSAKSYGTDSSALAFAWGIAAVKRNDQKAATMAVEQLASLRSLKKGAAARVIDVMSKELQALIEASHEADATAMSRALALAMEAVTIEETLGAPSGPPDTFKPAHELYGELLLRANRKSEAWEQFRISLLRTPNRRLSLVGADASRTPAATISLRPEDLVLLEDTALQR